MMAGTILLARENWLLPEIALLAVLLGFLGWTYRRVPLSNAARGIALALKTVGLLVLALCLLEPLWSGNRAKPGENQFLILADNSESMRLRDRGQTSTRGDLMQSLLTGPNAAWQDRAAADFQWRRYAFDTRLRSTADFHDLTFDGRATSLGAALKSLAELHHGQPTAGVLLFTDGNATDLKGPFSPPEGLPPVYPVVIGGDDAIRDVAISQVAVSQTIFEDAPVTVQAGVTALGYAGDKIVVRLLDRSGALVEQQSQSARRQEESLGFRFEVHPPRGGLTFYQLQVAPEREAGRSETPETTAEATLVNNTRLVAVDTGQGPYRVLYVSGRPNWEYKFLKRALENDSQIQLVGLIRVALREPKFSFRGGGRDTSNPLFRGFGPTNEMTERYDQPVLVRLNTRDELELRGGFPKTAEELYAYHAVVVDDLEAEFFTTDQQALLQRFVSERGGGFLMLGGAETFQQGKYRHTPVGDLLPVYLDPVDVPKGAFQYHLNLTAEGWLQPWARLRRNETQENTRLADLPPYAVLNPVRGIKPGASVIATVTGSGGRTYPALAVQRFGKGRTGALLVGDWWRSGLPSQESRQDLDKSWRQLIRWLVADVPERVEVQVEPKPGEANQSVELQVRVRDAEFRPLENATVHLRVQQARAGLPNTNVASMTADASPQEPGLYQATFVPRVSGGFQVDALVTNVNGAEVGRVRTGWTSDLAGEEFARLQPNRALLESLARQTGGEVVSPSRLEALVRQLPYRHAPIQEPWTVPLWHRSDVFLFVLACFLLEWGLRRWKGLP